jgi:hypothetical protein
MFDGPGNNNLDELVQALKTQFRGVVIENKSKLNGYQAGS